MNGLNFLYTYLYVRTPLFPSLRPPSPSIFFFLLPLILFLLSFLLPSSFSFFPLLCHAARSAHAYARAHARARELVGALSPVNHRGLH